jgi:hypothetical protein
VRNLNQEYENLVETSNQHHNAVYDYLEKHGSDNQFKIMIQGKIKWLQMVAFKNGLLIEED